jgi:hypothetical protein
MGFGVVVVAIDAGPLSCERLGDVHVHHRDDGRAGGGGGGDSWRETRP